MATQPTADQSSSGDESVTSTRQDPEDHQAEGGTAQYDDTTTARAPRPTVRLADQETQDASGDDTATPSKERGPVDLKVRDGVIQFTNVTFSHTRSNRPPTLRNISFRIEAGQNVVFVGNGGTGKTTLIKLLMGMHEGYTGTITVDGQDVSAVTQESRIQQISVAPQSVVLLDASILDNVRYGLNATREQCEAVCRAVCLHDRIMSLRRGYDEILGAEGVQCTEADAQKLGIARVLLTDNKIVVFDEAMSVLDRQTECRIMRHVREWCAGRTVITIAHRLGTVTLADMIYVLWDGEIVEQGTHGQLMAKNGTYCELWGHRGAI
ncbi:uncharacterized protein DNG_08130 [Cephalotrichum gorgonifer]|uniref:ABC transporter domain-containing protein n=1 Tax=Cephalotrichum gorgonifer TaxID=2041049 RepID=A0AAE8SY75_9PEZI|nr:uncharacterized protein DNG_08130 [Cephalotrichum gorgonifer]